MAPCRDTIGAKRHDEERRAREPERATAGSCRMAEACRATVMVAATACAQCSCRCSGKRYRKVLPEMRVDRDEGVAELGSV